MNTPRTRTLSLVPALIVILVLVSYAGLPPTGEHRASSAGDGTSSLQAHQPEGSATGSATGSTTHSFFFFASSSSRTAPTAQGLPQPLTSSSSSNTTAAAVVMAIASVATASRTQSSLPVVTRPSMGIVVPLYMGSDSNWTELEDAKEAFPSVPVIAIINPSNGSGTSSNSTYVKGVEQLQASGVVVLGYVDTLYATAPTVSAEVQISDYSSWYGVNGIFLDEMPSSSGYESYYSTLTRYADSLGMTYTMGNPGTNTSSSYAGTVSNLMIYENDSQPSSGTIAQDSFGGPPNGYSMIATDVSLPSESYLNSVAPYVEYVWFTNYQPDYQELPSPVYLDALMAECAVA